MYLQELMGCVVQMFAEDDVKRFGRVLVYTNIPVGAISTTIIGQTVHLEIHPKYYQSLEVKDSEQKTWCRILNEYLTRNTA